jgi:hypothetical protein
MDARVVGDSERKLLSYFLDCGLGSLPAAAAALAVTKSAVEYAAARLVRRGLLQKYPQENRRAPCMYAATVASVAEADADRGALAIFSFQFAPTAELVYPRFPTGTRFEDAGEVEMIAIHGPKIQLDDGASVSDETSG